MSAPTGLLSKIEHLQDTAAFRGLHWEGTFEDYLDLVRRDPRVSRTAFQRLYDMIVSYGSAEYTRNRETLIHYHFFDDPFENGKDAVFGLDKPLMELVRIFQSAARRYGTERRVLLLHGPVGTAKSTVVRLLKKGLEAYSRTDAGRLYSFYWLPDDGERMDCPMHEEPLHLIPAEFRPAVTDELNASRTGMERVEVEGDLCPACRYMFNRLLEKAGGNWLNVVGQVRVKRLLLSEKDRVGIGTFQPKDEKNQDSTELTGDINYRKIAEYGSDSDPRAFNFDGELNIANRGLVEFIEILKLDVAFLYDLLTASQEHKIKPKKFAHTDIDEVILGHSVSGATPIMYLTEGELRFTTLAQLHVDYADHPESVQVMSVNVETGQPEWTPVRGIFRHRYTGELLQTAQKWGAVETTPNHSIYDRDLRPFYPDERHEILALRQLPPMPQPVSELRLTIPGAVAEVGDDFTTPPQAGWLRLNRPRFAPQVRGDYGLDDPQSLNDLLTLMTWYLSEGHVNGRNGGVVMSQADRDELERVRLAYQSVSTGKGSIDFGARTDSAWRLYLGADIARAMLEHYCGGSGATQKRLPDFVFNLPAEQKAHVLRELIATDGSRFIQPGIEALVSNEYRDQYFEFKTISPVLAAQVGTLCSMLGYDYSVYTVKRGERPDAYRIRYCTGPGKRGGRNKRFTPFLHRRVVQGEWVYDIECIGNHNFVCGIGNVVCHNTNEAEYRRLLSNEYMEALRDRTIKIDIPYVTRFGDEVKIYERDFNERRVVGKHIAPHTLEIAGLWAVLTRLEEPKRAGLTLLQKLKLYDGRSLPGFTEDSVIELQAEARNEGMNGISPRYIQDKLSNSLVGDQSRTCLNPFMLMRELETGLKHHSLITSDEQRKRYRELLSVVRGEYDEIVKNEVQRAITADEAAIKRLAANYIDNIKAYTQKQKVRNPYTGQDEPPDERLMRAIEEKIEIPESRKDDFRREIMNYIGALALDGKTFAWDSNERLRRALELKLFEDQKDSIKLTSLVSNVMDSETQEKIEVVKSRLIKNMGYCDVCATDVLNYVASIFARGDTAKR